MIQEEWLIDGDDGTGWRRDVYGSRLAAIHAGDELFNGAPFWVGRRTTFDEWIDLTWFPTDDVLTTLDFSDGFRPSRILTPLISLEDGEEFDRVCRESAKELLRKSEGLSSYTYMVEVEPVDRELKIQVDDESKPD